MNTHMHYGKDLTLTLTSPASEIVADIVESALELDVIALIDKADNFVAWTDQRLNKIQLTLARKAIETLDITEILDYDILHSILHLLSLLQNSFSSLLFWHEFPQFVYRKVPREDTEYLWRVLSTSFQSSSDSYSTKSWVNYTINNGDVKRMF